MGIENAQGEPELPGSDVHGRPGRLATGIPGFDTIAGGGIVAGRSALLVGTSGSGKTIFGLQFLVEGVRQFGETGVLVTFEEVPEEDRKSTRLNSSHANIS